MHPTFLHFPRNAATLQIHVTFDGVSAALYGPQEHGIRPEFFTLHAPLSDCWRTTAAAPTGGYPERLFFREASLALTLEEAMQVDELLRAHTPAALPLAKAVSA